LDENKIMYRVWVKNNAIFMLLIFLSI